MNLFRFVSTLAFALSVYLPTASASSSFSLLNQFQSWQARQTKLQVVDENNQPVGHAQILIGTSLDQPFAHNFLTTSETGELVVPDGWTTALPVTIQAPGFVRMTYDAMLPTQNRLMIRHGSTHARLGVKGLTSGYGPIPQDDNAHVALVVPAFTWDSIATFEISSLLSTESDAISTPISTIHIPSNLTVPAQNLKYGFFSVHVDKPNYRLILPDAGRVELSAIRARFPFQQVADMLRNKAPFTEVLRQFTFESVGLRAFDLTHSMDQDMPVNEHVIQPQANYQAPQIPSDQVMLAAYLNRTAENRIFPTDVKSIDSNEKVTLGGIAGLAGYRAVIRMQKTGDNLNFVDQVGTSKANALSLYEVPLAPRAIAALDLVGVPQVTPTQVAVAAPNATGVSDLSLMTQVTLQKVEENSSGMGKVQRAFPQWTLIHSGWTSQMPIPQWPNDTLKGDRWEISFAARGSQEQHVTRNHTQTALSENEDFR